MSLVTDIDFPDFDLDQEDQVFFSFPTEKTAFSSRIQRLFRFSVQDVEGYVRNEIVALNFTWRLICFVFCPIRFVLNLGPDFPKITYPGLVFHHAKQTEIIQNSFNLKVFGPEKSYLKYRSPLEVQLMEIILHHLGCIKPDGYWDIYYINWKSPDF